MKNIVLHFLVGTPYIEALTDFERRIRKKLFGVKEFKVRKIFKTDTFFDKSIIGGGFM